MTRGLGLSAFVSIGNKADVSTNDLLEWWEDDDATEAILLYVESFGNPRRFGRLARRVARRKPILALKSGTSASGQRAASSHTAALAGSEAAVDALFRQAGVIRATSLEELIDAATLLSSQPRLAGRSSRSSRTPAGSGSSRRRVRGRRARAPLARRRDRRRLRELLPPRRASRTRSTCSAARPPSHIRAGAAALLADPRWTPSSSSSSRR